MELRHLRYFIAVAEEENVTRAALRLHLSQPALSRQIRDLEEELGFLLLVRSPKSVRLTEAGRVFLSEARAVLERADDAVKAARSIAKEGGGELQVGYAPSLTARILPQTLCSFQSEFPSVRVKLHDLSTQEVFDALCERRLHIAFIARPTASMLQKLQFAELAREPLRLAVAPNHEFSNRRYVSLAEAASQPFIAYSGKEYPEANELLADIFAPLKLKPRIQEEHESVSSLIAVVEAGRGVALVTESLACTAGLRLKLVELEPPPQPLVIGAAWLKNELSIAAQRFLNFAKTVASQQFNSNR